MHRPLKGGLRYHAPQQAPLPRTETLTSTSPASHHSRVDAQQHEIFREWSERGCLALCPGYPDSPPSVVQLSSHSPPPSPIQPRNLNQPTPSAAQQKAGGRDNPKVRSSVGGLRPPPKRIPNGSTRAGNQTRKYSVFPDRSGAVFVATRRRLCARKSSRKSACLHGRSMDTKCQE